jgi:putative addiction module killer protein
MTEEQYEIEFYVNENGEVPFLQWLSSFNDKKIKHRIESRLDRLVLGNFGDHHYVAEGISELRFNFGSGYRIYYGIYENRIVLLLCAGDKSSQRKDIYKAINYWKDYIEG